MVDEDGAPGAPGEAAPSPRRTRDGLVLVGPSLRARYLPGALIGLPMVSLLLAPFAAAGLEQWRDARAAAGAGGPLVTLLEPMAVQMLLGWLLLWALLALWALVPMIATHRVVLLDEAAGTVRLRRGLRAGEPVPVSEVVYAVGEAERGYEALIGIGAPDRPEDQAARQWRVPNIGWDDAGFDGLRALQSAAGLRAAPPRPVLLAESRRLRRAGAHQEMAQRIGMPWREEYAHDDAAFQRDFDHARRVLGGKEPPAGGGG